MRSHKMISVALAITAILGLYFYSYPVRELIAASILFSVAFTTVATALLLLFLIQNAVLRGTKRLERIPAYVRERHLARRDPKS